MRISHDAILNNVYHTKFDPLPNNVTQTLQSNGNVIFGNKLVVSNFAYPFQLKVHTVRLKKVASDHPSRACFEYKTRSARVARDAFHDTLFLDKLRFQDMKRGKFMTECVHFCLVC